VTAGGAGGIDEVLYVVITPDGQLVEERADGRPDADDPDDPYQSALWAAVRQAVAPGIKHDPDEPVMVDSLPLPEQTMRIKFLHHTEAAQHPDLLRPNPYASAVVHILGLRLDKALGGRVAIMCEEDAETALTPSLSEQQLAAIRATHDKVVIGAGEAAQWRFS
jgi:hypothetical protein